MDFAFCPGMLVELRVLFEPTVQDAETLPSELDGSHAQLISFIDETQLWAAITFGGNVAFFDECELCALDDSDMKGYDYVLGPQSDIHVMGENLTQRLLETGRALFRIILREDTAHAIFDMTSQLRLFNMLNRPAAEFESGYLGRDRAAQIALVNAQDPEAPAFVRDSPLPDVERYFLMIGSMLKRQSEELLGFTIHSQSHTMIQLPLWQGEESSCPPLGIDHQDAKEYIDKMHRRRLTLLLFLNTHHGIKQRKSGRIILHSKRVGLPDVELDVEPFTILCILDSCFEYTFEPRYEDSMVLQVLVLDQPATFVIRSVCADSSWLGVLGGGSPPPQKDLQRQVSLISMDCRYGGNAKGAKQYWAAACKGGTDGVTWVPPDRWDWEQHYEPDSPDGVYTQHGCFGIEEVHLFDNRFFDLTAREVQSMDPLQRQVMEVSYLALKRCGWNKLTLKRQTPSIGCFVGMDKDDWMEMNACRMSPKEYRGTSASWSITSNRVSFSLNLQGPSMTIDTACSSSLVATHVAKQSLRNQDYESLPAALVSGVNLLLSVKFFQVCCGAKMLSRKGRCFTYDGSADGYTRAELCGSGVFKLQQAMESSSWACLAGSMVNQDGRSASLTAPNGPSQQRALMAVIRELDVSTHEIDCIECHATGTALGDPIEIKSILGVLSHGIREEPLLICSSKSVIAHGEGGAGFGGFFKCCVMVMHCEASGNLHLKEINEHIDIDRASCAFLSEALTMRRTAYAGVNSFGFGGTNAHAQVWGKNTLTSRRIHADERVLFRSKLKTLNPAEVFVTGSSYLDWATTGADPRAQIGEQFTIDVTDDGDVLWHKVTSSQPPDGCTFFIQGTHNNWRPEPLERNFLIEGLWVGSIIIGSSKEEKFQILANERQDMIYSPAEDCCTSRAADVHGPSRSSHSWLLRGGIGETFQVEFFTDGDSKSITWLK